MEYGRFIVLGYSTYRVRSSKSKHTNRYGTSPYDSIDTLRLPPGQISKAVNLQSPNTKTKQMWEPIGDQNAYYVLKQRIQPNGITLKDFHYVKPQNLSHLNEAVPIKEISSSRWKTIATNITRNLPTTSSFMCIPLGNIEGHLAVMEYMENSKYDMFQIGRLPCLQNDFVIPGPRVGLSGTISRFAIRIICSRLPPYTCQLFAGGFDSTRHMITATYALKYCTSCGNWMKEVEPQHVCFEKLKIRDYGSYSATVRKLDSNNSEDSSATGDMVADIPLDGLTKNGVRVYLPEQRQWFEVSVSGALYPIEPRRAVGSKNSDIQLATSNQHTAFNRPISGPEQSITPVLTDGAIIDLGGVHLQFQSGPSTDKEAAQGLDTKNETPRLTISPDSVAVVAAQLQQMNVQCPIAMQPLSFTNIDQYPIAEWDDKLPSVFPACGHVFGYNTFIKSSGLCPLCRTKGEFVPLILKPDSRVEVMESNQIVPECVLNPCGHTISQYLANYYASLVMPNGQAICPFCARSLDTNKPFSKLYLYSD